MDLNDRGKHGIFARFLRKFTRAHDFLESQFVLALLPMRTAFPEMSERDEVFLCSSALGFEDKIERLDRRIDFLCTECSECLDHAQSEIVVERAACGGTRPEIS